MGSKWCIYRLGDIAEFSYGKMPKKEFVGTGDYVIFSGYKYTESYPEKNTSAGELIVVARGVGGLSSNLSVRRSISLLFSGV